MNDAGRSSEPLRVSQLDVESLPRGVVSRLRVEMVRNGLGDPIRIPVLVARGRQGGPVLGFTAAIHGNELNGVRIVQRLVPELPLDELRGTIVAIPVVNVPGYLRNQREYEDNVDLNRVMPGREVGTNSEIYAYRFMDRIVRHLDVLIDLHTASFGRVNSLYVRADMKNPVTARLAYLQCPQIIVHNEGGDGTMRSAAADRGIPAITVEVGDPQRFQRKLIRRSLVGIQNVLAHLEMLPEGEEPATQEPVLCGRSYWLHTDRGGVLEVVPDVADRVRKGALIARVRNMFGDVTRTYDAPQDGIVIGKSVNPVNPVGSRILHLGVEGLPTSYPDPSQTLSDLPKIVR